MKEKHFSETETRLDDVATFIQSIQGLLLFGTTLILGFTAIIFNRVNANNSNLFYLLIGSGSGGGSALIQSTRSKYQEENNLMVMRQPKRDEDMP